MDYVRNFGAIRRAMLHEIFNGRRDDILNYNPHPSPKAWIGQVIVLKKNKEQTIDGFKNEGIIELPENSCPLELSPNSKHLNMRREKTTTEHEIQVLRYWETIALNNRDEVVVQLHDALLEKAKEYLQLMGVKKKAQSNREWTTARDSTWKQRK